MVEIFEGRFLRLSQIVGDKKKGITPIVPVSKSSWWAGVKEGRYPQPIKFGPRTTVWKAGEIFALGEKKGGTQ